MAKSASAKRERRIRPVDEVELMRHACTDWRLSRGDVGVYAVLLQHCDADRKCFPGPSRIASLAHLHLSKVKDSLPKLERLKYLQIHRPGPRIKNSFTVLESPRIPSRMVEKMGRETRRELGCTRPEDEPRSERRRKSKEVAPSGLVEAFARAGTRPESGAMTRPPFASQLGAPAGHEVAFKTPMEERPLACEEEE